MIPPTEFFFVLALLGVSILALYLALQLRSAGKLVRSLESHIEQLSGVQKKRGALEAELNFLTSFLREYADLSRTLHSDLRLRQIPDAIQSFLVKLFNPEEAVVLVRRKASSSLPTQTDQFVVASSTDKLFKIGRVIEAGTGELGVVAEANRVMERLDLAAVRSSKTGSQTHDVLREFQIDLAAPMMVGDQTLGVIAISKPAKESVYSKTVMYLVSQSAATALSNAKAMVEIRSGAETDSLTNVYNKGALSRLLDRELVKAELHETNLAVFLLDIDHFKNYNDTNGHLAGDELLRELAGLISDQIRAEDIFGRFGGEEFLLILPDRTVELGAHVAENIRKRIETHTFPNAKSQPLGKLTISGGVAGLKPGSYNSREILSAADEALYKAKSAGRNRVLQAESN